MAILANLITPRVQIAVSKRSAKRRQEKIAKLYAELEEIRAFRASTHGEFLAFCTRKIIYFISQSILVIVADVTAVTFLLSGSQETLNSTQELIAIGASIVTFSVVWEANRIMTYINKIQRFERYEKELTQQLRKLGQQQPTGSITEIN